MTQTQQAPSTAAISLRDVRKSFGTVEAVRGIDLEIHPGEVVAFLGPNGAGKTSTIDMVLGLSEPTSGDVSVLGLRPRQAIARGLVSAVMQTGGLLKDVTVRETVAYTASLFAQARGADEVLADAGITGLADRKVGGITITIGWAEIATTRSAAPAPAPVEDFDGSLLDMLKTVV